MNDQHSLLLAFNTDDPQFVRGFEAGRVWNAVRASDDDPIVETVHLSNAEVMLRIGEAVGRDVSWVELDDTFAEVTFS